MTAQVPPPASSQVVVDASVWVARLVPQDVFHSSVTAWLEKQRAAGVQFLSPALLLVEAAGAISRRTGDPRLAKQAAQSLERLPAVRLVVLDRSLLRQAASLAAELGLRGADAVYVSVAARLGLPLATLDTDQRLRASHKVSILEIASP